MVVRSIVSHGAVVSAYLQRASPRERLLLAGLALLALILAPLKAYDWSQTQLSALQSEKAALQSARQADDPVRIRRALAQFRAEKRSVQAWSFVSPSFPVARVQMEQVAAEAAVRGGVLAPDVKSDELPVTAGGALFVRVELSGPFTWASLDALVQNLSRTGKGFVIDTASVEDDGIGARPNFAVAPAKFHLVLLLPVRLQPVALVP